MTSNQVVYESPDGGNTIYSRAMGAPHQQRVLIKTGTLCRDQAHAALWQAIHAAAMQDPALDHMLQQVEIYYHLHNQDTQNTTLGP